MYKGSVIDHGMARSTFDKFDVVCSGHYHHRSSRGNIHYLGCPYEMTWSDYNDPKGFHIFDTKTRELKFVPNPFVIFHKLVYDDAGKTINQTTDYEYDKYKNAFVKVIVKNKTNPYWFDMVIDKLEKAGATQIQVVDDNLNLTLDIDDGIIDEAEDTITILKNYVNNLELDADKVELESLMRELYSEAMSLE
jgi:DNA repair exonuclease SbcCD nuclease subunit